MKIVILFLILISFYVARIFSAYHDNSLFKNHIKLRNKLFGYILIGKVPSSKINVDRSKIMIQGIVIYALCIFTLFFCIYNLYFSPIIEEDIILLQSRTSHRGVSAPLIVHTVNDAVSILMCTVTLSLELALSFAEGMKSVYNNSEASTSSLILNMLLNLSMTLIFLYLLLMSLLRIITLFN